MKHRICKVCQTELTGRSDQIFCSLVCKNYYHLELRKLSAKIASTIDRILHRNRSILLELMGKKRRKLKLSRIELERKKFIFKYSTHSHINKEGKIYFYIYDFAWMEFSDNEILILRVKERKAEIRIMDEVI